MSSELDNIPWYEQPCFHRYWRHYAQTYSWYKQHLHASVEQDNCAHVCHSHTLPRVPFVNNTEFSNDQDDSQFSSTCDEDEENIEMEITEDIISFFEQSEKHRKELKTIREKQRKEKEKNDVLASRETEASWAHKRSTELPINLQTNTKRESELKCLYGAASAMIHGMETAVQLSYDRHCDLNQPQYWPVIPLNLKF